MKYLTRMLPLLVILASALILSSCSGNSTSYGTTSWPGMTADADTAYVAYNQYVYAVNLASGTEKWRYPTEKPKATVTFFAEPFLTGDGQLIVGSYDHNLYSLAVETGQVRWTFSQAKDRYIGSPLVTEDMIYAPNADGNLYALDLNGQLKWTFTSEQPLWSQPTLNKDGNTVYLSSMDQRVYALQADTGSKQWETVDLGGAVVASPIPGPDGTLYVGTFAGEMLALDNATGSVKWRYPTTAWVWSAVALDDHNIYFGDIKGNLHAVAMTGGEKVWMIETSQTISSKPLIKGEQIYYTTEGPAVYAIDLNGHPLWEQNLGGNIYAPVHAAGDALLITPTSKDALLVALTDGGATRWTFTPGK